MEKHNYDKLRGRIKEKLKSEVALVPILNKSQSSINMKLNSITPFSIEEIETLIEILEIPDEEIKIYFFDKKVEKSSTIKNVN